MAMQLLILALPGILLSRAPFLGPVGSVPGERCSDFWHGKPVLLTGASSGLGKALSIELASRGARLVLAARRQDRLESVASACSALAPANSVRPAVLVLDACAAPAVLEAKVAEATALLGGRIDVLLSAAGVGQRSSVLATSAESHRQIMGANFEGNVALTRAVLPAMVEQKEGNICMVSSVQGFFGQPYRSSYAASKAAVFGFFDALRAEVAPANVKVTIIAPGD